MGKLLMNSIKRQKTTSILFIIACALILFIMPLSLASLQETQTQVETDVTHYARGSYDLLVQPEGSQHELEQQLDAVPENYLGVGQGGITVDQWETIKQKPEIEIAAPVASLGYFTGIRTNIGVLPVPEESTQYGVQYYTSDGVNQYPVGTEQVGILLETPLPHQKFEELVNSERLLNQFTNTAQMFDFPLMYHLLVGIDPYEESALTGISFEEITEESNTSGWGTVLKSDLSTDAEIVPVMQLADGAVSLEMEITMDTLGIGLDEVQAYRDQLGLENEIAPRAKNMFMNLFGTEEYDQLVEELTDYPGAERQTRTVDLKDHLHPFDPGALIVNEKEELSELEADGTLTETIDLEHISTYYTAGDVKYEVNGDSLAVKQVGEENGVPTYREVNQEGITGEAARERGEDRRFIIDPVGEFKIGSNQEQLAASPLGIYRLEPVNYIGDGDEQSIPMQATITPGSFVPAPASGVTNIQAAAMVKGNEPIDAIRIKVAGIHGYTTEAADKIDEIAEEIRDMGLQVSVVAGASHQLVDVEVEGVGLVQEAWTTLGAAGSVISQWNVTNILLAIIFVLVSFIYIYNRVLFWHVRRQDDMAMLQRLGWENRHIRRLFTGEIGVLTILSWALALGGLVLTQWWVNIPGYVFLWQIGITIVIVMLLGFFMLKKLQLLHGLKERRGGDRQLARKRPNRILRSTKSLTVKNLSYFRKFVAPSFVQLLAVSALSSFVYLSLTETVQQTNLTLLGQYINVQVSEWHYLLILAAYVLAFLRLIESLTSMLISRQREIGYFRSLGWELSHIFKLYFKEVLLWTGIAIFFGSTASLIAFAFVYQMYAEAWLVTGVSFIILYICTALVTALILRRLLTKELGNTLLLKRKGNHPRSAAGE